MTDDSRYAVRQHGGIFFYLTDTRLIREKVHIIDGSEYTVLNASRANEKADFVCTVAGRCCESGDLIQEDVAVANPKRGDILAVLCTGAYNYSMASNYNRICRPAVVIVKDGKTRLGIRRETFEDLIRNDM